MRRKGEKGKRRKGKGALCRFQSRSLLLTIVVPFILLLFALSLFSLFSPLFWSPALADGDPKRLSAATREDRLKIFDEVCQIIRERYYDPTFHGLDWQSVNATFRPLAAEARDTAELYAVLRRMLSRLGDAHTRIYAPGECADWRRQCFVTVGVTVREIAGEIIVVNTERESEAERRGVRAGDRVVSIDGQPVETVFAVLLEEQTGTSSITAARAQATAKLFHGPLNSFVAVGFARDGEHEKTVRLQRILHVRPIIFRMRRIGDYGLVHFNAFTQETAVEFMRALRGELRGVRGIILDLRNNGGGEAEAMTDIASVFLPRGTSMGRFTDREGRIAFEPQTRAAMLLSADMVTSFRGPVIILTGAKTASAAEIFVAALKEAQRAIIIGEDTCGCVLGIRRRHPLPDGGRLDISEMNYHTAGGARLEGSSVMPDERITPGRHDFQAGRDRAVERAIETIKRMGEKGKRGKGEIGKGEWEKGDRERGN